MELEDILRLVEALNARGVDYVVVGGVAARRSVSRRPDPSNP
jgi:diphthamide synthase (EF-2-diphthine--ammonia ligase)